MTEHPAKSTYNFERSILLLQRFYDCLLVYVRECEYMRLLFDAVLRAQKERYDCISVKFSKLKQLREWMRDVFP